MSNAVSRWFGNAFSKKETSQSVTGRTTPRFIEEEIKRQATPVAVDRGVQMSGLVHATGFASRGGQYYSDGQKFRGGIVFSGSSPIIDHNRTRNNAREAYHTSTVAQAMVKRFVEIVVGDGIRIEPKPSADILGISQQEAEQWARDFKDRFNLWADSKQVTLREDMNLYQLQRLAETESQRDGEYFKRFYYLDEPGRVSPLAIDTIEQSQIVGNPYTVTQGTPWTRDGIERDSRGREIGYLIRVRQTNGTYKDVHVPAFSDGRRVIVHGFTPEYSTQGRGYSGLHPVLQEFSQLTNFTIAQIEKAIIQASIVLSKETDAGSIPTGTPFMAGMSGVSPVVPAPAATSTLDDDTTTSTSVPDYRPVDAAISPGGIGVFNNGPGEKLKAFNDTAPSDSFAPFTEAFISILCAAKSMPYEVLLQKFNSNYTASRAALVQAYRYARILQGEHVSDFLSEVQEAWASEEIAAGRIVANGWLDPLMRRAWLTADWQGPQMPDIDPTKSITAAKDAIEAELSNVSLEARRYNGTDAAMNRAINERVLDGAQRAHWNGDGRQAEREQEKKTQKIVEEQAENTNA